MPREGNKTMQAAVRLTPELAERIEAYAARMREQVPGSNFTVADAMRVLITKGLDAAEGTTKSKGKG